MTRNGAKEKLAEVIELRGRGPALGNAQLVEGILRKDPSAAIQFHRRFGARISRLTWRLLGADAEHEDLVNQIFVNILSSLGKLKKRDSLAEWVDSVTFRTVRKELRSRKLRRTLVPSSDYLDHTLDKSPPTKQIHVRRFYAILGQMKTEDRMIFVLRYLEGHSLEEVAAMGGYSLSTAKRRIKRAKEEFENRAEKDSILASLFKSYDHVD